MSEETELDGAVREFVLGAFAIGNPNLELTDTTDLVDGGIIDSMKVLRLVEFMEGTYDIMLEPDDLFQLTSIANIASVIRIKLDE